jgi:hypothetical protein
MFDVSRHADSKAWTHKDMFVETGLPLGYNLGGYLPSFAGQAANVRAFSALPGANGKN